MSNKYYFILFYFILGVPTCTINAGIIAKIILFWHLFYIIAHVRTALASLKQFVFVLLQQLCGCLKFGIRKTVFGSRGSNVLESAHLWLGPRYT